MMDASRTKLFGGLLQLCDKRVAGQAGVRAVGAVVAAAGRVLVEGAHRHARPRQVVIYCGLLVHRARRAARYARRHVQGQVRDFL